MRKYLVTISIIGSTTIEILAKNKSEADELAFDLSKGKIFEDLDFSMSVDDIEFNGWAQKNI